MSNLTNIPQVDGFETTLAQAWNGAVGTLYVNAIPGVTLPVGEKTYVTVDPGKTTQQVARVSAWTTGQITIDSITVKKGAGLNYTQQSHSVGAKVIISDNYQFWSDIKDAVNSKLDNNTDIAWDSATTFAGLKAKSLTTTQRDALTPSTGLIIYNSTAGALEQYIGGSWQSFATGTTPNASTTVAGKVEEATQVEVEEGTDTGGTGARNFVTPSKINPSNITSATIATGDRISFSDISDSNKLKSGTIGDIASIVSRFGGDSSDGVQGDANLTITGSNNTYITKNFSSWTAGSTTRTCTVTPTGCIVHIKIKGNADFTNWTFDFSGKGAAGGASSTAGSSSPVILQSSPNLGGSQGSNVTVGSFGGGGGSGNGANGSTIGGAGGIKGSAVPLTSIQGKRTIEIACGAGGGGGGFTGGETGGTGGAGGGVLVIEVLGNVILNNSTTIVNMNGTDGTAGSNIGGNRAGGGGGGGGGCFYLMHNGTLTGTCTPTFAGGAGGASGTGQSSSGGAGGAGGAGLALIEQNKVFS